MDLVESDAGLYEVQRGDKKGGATRRYDVVLEHPEHALIKSVNCEEQLAKLLDMGVSIRYYFAVPASELPGEE